MPFLNRLTVSALNALTLDELNGLLLGVESANASSPASMPACFSADNSRLHILLTLALAIGIGR